MKQVEAITTAVRTYVPGSNVILNNPKVLAGANEAAKIIQDQIAQVQERWSNAFVNSMWLSSSISGSLPDLYCFIKAPRGDALAVRRPRHR